MFDADNLRKLIKREQARLTLREVELSPIAPSIANAMDMLGCIDLSDVGDMRNYEEARTLHFLQTNRMQVSVADEGGSYQSLEEALPGGRDQWKLVYYHVCPIRMALLLRFLPISGKLEQEAARYLDAVKLAWPQEEKANPTDIGSDESDERKSAVNALVRRYSRTLMLTGSYEVFLEGMDASEYIRSGKASVDKTKARLRYVELAQDLKTGEYVITEGRETMIYIPYY